MNKPLWEPSSESISNAGITRFITFVNNKWGADATDFNSLHRWSIQHSADFWESIWEFSEVRASRRGEAVVCNSEKMPGATWFPDATLNYTENILRRNDDGAAIIFRGENKEDVILSHAELTSSVNRLARAYRGNGIQPGDRIVGYLPNIPETVICMLAAASCGAVWSSCSPDFGEQGVLDRFGQINPKILVSIDGYTYNGKTFDITQKRNAIVNNLPSLETSIVIPYLNPDNPPAGSTSLEDYVENYSDDPVEHVQLPFNHPLFILFSSGTTGAPKCIVHGAGGTLLQHLKEHRLHVNLRRDDRIFFFTTCGWMMWNWLVTALASEATIVLYEGFPFCPKNDVFFDYLVDHRINQFGVSAKYIDTLAKAQVRPKDTHDLSHLRTFMSTGSPLSPEGFDYVYDAVKDDVCLSSISGGTDLISCFVLGNPTLPVRRGEIQCKGLGMDVAVFDDDGNEVDPGIKGELVCRNSFPSMPIGFWNDENDNKYRAAYFEKFPGNWHHGDYVEITEHGGMIVYGRSDAVLNPSGVRIGTAEIYRQAEQVEEVVEGLVIGQIWDSDTRVVLFVRLREGLTLTEELVDKIRKRIRFNASPRHVPAKIIQVEDIPRTKNGKIVELAVHKIVHGKTVDNIEALANPEALELFRDLPELATD